jgi:hypothetical protein
MHIAKELGKSVEEVMQFSVLEIQLWASYFKIQHDEAKKGMNHGRNSASRTRRR